MAYFIPEYKVIHLKFGSFDENLKIKFERKRRQLKYEIGINGYETICLYHKSSNIKSETYLYPKNNDPQQCIFCLKFSPDVSFKKNHTLPHTF